MPVSRRKKYDVVVVAVRYETAGKIEWVRAYERKGPIWSDRRMIKREDLIARLQAGEKIVTGERIQFEAGTFRTGEALRVEQKNGQTMVISGSVNGSGDTLKDVPIL